MLAASVDDEQVSLFVCISFTAFFSTHDSEELC